MKFKINTNNKTIVVTLDELKALDANAELIRACQWLEQCQLDPIPPCGCTLESGAEIAVVSDAHFLGRFTVDFFKGFFTVTDNARNTDREVVSFKNKADAINFAHLCERDC